MSFENRIDFLSPVSVVAGLGPKRIAALEDAGIFTVGDLLLHLPRRYIDRSVITPVVELDQWVDGVRTIVGEVTRTRVERGARPRIRAQVTDASGSIDAVWFAGVPYLRKILHTGMRVVLTGKVSRHTALQMVHPLMETVREGVDRPEIPFLPRYALTSAMREAGIGQKNLHKCIDWCLQNVKHYPAVLPKAIEEKRSFPPLSECLHRIHQPEDLGALEPYYARLQYEELYRLAVTLRWSRRKYALPGRSLSAGALHDVFVKSLPFTLTEDQSRAVALLHADARGDRRMRRLLHGDVGSGKTVVAFAACLPALNEGLQVAWMAPTEILARQTHALVSQWLTPLGLTARLLTGEVDAGDRRAILKDLASGVLRFVVGTHALLQPAVKFARLGMAVVDEQHRFGAQQRLSLIEKDLASDVLFMSATPIPQTLARTLYGDLELVSLRQLPAGRSPVTTRIVPEARRNDMEQFILRQITGKDAQVFYVAPRIEPPDDGDSDDPVIDVMSAFRKLTQGVFAPVQAGLLHGGMDARTRSDVMASFARGDIKLLVSTTVIEVGVDVPRASVMVIENAERFGLAQLHQLRGRVGRGSGESYCFLLAEVPPGSMADQRLQFLRSEHDGFAIADADLRMRGPGEVVGDRQSGWEDLRFADILTHAGLFREIQEELDLLLGR